MVSIQFFLGIHGFHFIEFDSQYTTVFHAQDVTCLTLLKVQFFHTCLYPDLLISDLVLPRYTKYPLLKPVMCSFQLFLLYV